VTIRQLNKWWSVCVLVCNEYLFYSVPCIYLVTIEKNGPLTPHRRFFPPPNDIFIHYKVAFFFPCIFRRVRTVIFCSADFCLVDGAALGEAETKTQSFFTMKTLRHAARDVVITQHVLIAARISFWELLLKTWMFLRRTLIKVLFVHLLIYLIELRWHRKSDFTWNQLDTVY
jgi:hypothetical protein